MDRIRQDQERREEKRRDEKEEKKRRKQNNKRNRKEETRGEERKGDRQDNESRKKSIVTGKSDRMHANRKSARERGYLLCQPLGEGVLEEVGQRHELGQKALLEQARKVVLRAGRPRVQPAARLQARAG